MRFTGLRERLREEGGFTLPEVLVAMTMMVTVLFALYAIFDMSLRVFSFGNDKIEAVENARIGLERMEREIRAAYPQDDDTLLNTWTDDTISFYNKPAGNIAYSVYQTGDGNYALGRSVDGGDRQPVVEFLDGTGGADFDYCKSATDCSSEVTNEENIEMVRITLKTRVPGRQDGTQVLTTTVDLRNRQP